MQRNGNSSSGRAFHVAAEAEKSAHEHSNHFQTSQGISVTCLSFLLFELFVHALAFSEGLIVLIATNLRCLCELKARIRNHLKEKLICPHILPHQPIIHKSFIAQAMETAIRRGWENSPLPRLQHRLLRQPFLRQLGLCLAPAIFMFCAHIFDYLGLQRLSTASLAFRNDYKLPFVELCTKLAAQFTFFLLRAHFSPLILFAVTSTLSVLSAPTTTSYLRFAYSKGGRAICPPSRGYTLGSLQPTYTLCSHIKFVRPHFLPPTTCYPKIAYWKGGWANLPVIYWVHILS